MTLSKCRFCPRRKSIFLGPPGVGKRHLAISFSIEAITQEYTALDDLVAERRKANEKGTLERLVNHWSRPDILYR